ncbi:MAG: HAMP domain-containing histidine kinase, partial [Ruminococcus sp.]|nr:HAMP domain-containing histidine kinase [Ruminococcus sp.]
DQTKTVTTTKSAQTTAAATTKAAQQTTTQAATEPVIPEPTTGYQGPPNIDDRPFDDGHNPDDYIYPETEDWERWNSYSNSLNAYSYNWDDEESDESSGLDVYIETESNDYDTDSDNTEIMLLSGNTASPLDGFTVLAAEVESIPDPELKEWGEPGPKSLGSIDFFVVMADEDGNYLASLNNEELTEATAQSYITRILKKDETSGLLDKLQYYTLEKENGTIMVFTDKSAELDTLDQLTYTTILIGVISMIVLSILTLFISKKSIQPIKTAFEKQKQFISDASHELKTPLTIISANADVLSDEIGDNKWLDYIKSQADRMNVLVNDLLNLTRLENNTSDFICAKFNLSKAIENTALPFECQAFEQNKVFDIDIQDELYITGSERHIKQMAAIFIDNALKYSDEGGTVRITLRAQGDKKILSVFNTGSGVREDEKDKIFERFYRSDDSRARTTGGYGLGLAIAKSIIDKHKFKVTVDNDEGSSICFNVTM